MKNKNKILIVDDIGEYAMALEMYLPEASEVIYAASADEAKSAVEINGAPDLAMIDVRLNSQLKEDKSGMELLSWIRTAHPHTPVIMISAYQTFEYEIEALERGAIRFLKKPLQPVEVKAALSKVFDL